jgi:hypothetical protein
VKSHRKYNKRESNAPLKTRKYHWHQPDDVKFTDMERKVVGLKQGKHNGIGVMYNIQTDPDLGLGRLPCVASHVHAVAALSS